MIKGSLFGFLLLFSLYLFGQEYQFRNLTTEHGLPSNEVYSITSDKEGYLWFCTDKGVSKYDGKHFKTFTMANGLKSSVVFRLNEDSLGRLWTVNFGNYVQYIYNDSVYQYPYKITSTSWDTNRAVTGAQMNMNHTGLVIDDGNKGYYVFKEGQKGLFEDKLVVDYKESVQTIRNEDSFNLVYYLDLSGFNYPTFKKKAIPQISPFYELIQVQNYHLLRIPLKYSEESFEAGKLNFKFTRLGQNLFLAFCSEGYYVLFDREKIKESGRIKLKDIECIKVFKGDKYLIGTKFGAYKAKTLDSEPMQILRGFHITSIEKDFQGGIWFSTLRNGLFQFPSIQTTLLVKNEKIASIRIKNHNAFYSTDYGSIHSIDREGIKKIHWKDPRRPYDKYPFFLLDNGNILIPGGLVINENKIVRRNPQVEYSYNAFKDFTFWKNKIISGGSFGIQVFDVKGKSLVDSNLVLIDYLRKVNKIETIDLAPSHFLRINSISGLAKNLWIGSEAGLFLYSDGQFNKVLQTNAELGKRVNSIITLKSNRLLVSAAGNHLFLLDSKNEDVQIIKKIMLDIDVNISTIFYLDSLVMVGTNRGLYILNLFPLVKVINKIDKISGLSSNDVRAIDTFNNQVWIGTSSGISCFSIQKLQKRSQIPLLHVNNFIVNNQAIQITSKLDAYKFDSRDILINYQAVDFSGSRSLSFRYFLEGFSNDTINTSNDNVRFTNLNPGDYRFQVWVKSDKSVWSPMPRVVNFSISRYYWETWWFKGLIGLTLILIFGYAIKEYNSRKQKQLNTQLQTLELKQKALAAMMSPHFINNSLSAIQNLVNKGEKEQSNNFISKFATLIRQNMNAVNKGSISIYEEIERLTLYLNLEKLRFGDNLSYNIIFEDNLNEEEDLLIPAMLIQPFVENAIWHGILPKKLGKVEVVFKLITKSLLEVQIVDDGVGFGVGSKKEGHTSLSMNIIEQRLDLLADETGLDCGIKIKPGSNGIGTTVNVRMPIY